MAHPSATHYPRGHSHQNPRAHSAEPKTLARSAPPIKACVQEILCCYTHGGIRICTLSSSAVKGMAAAVLGTEREAAGASAAAVLAVAAAAKSWLALLALTIEAINTGAEDHHAIYKQLGRLKSETVPEPKDGSDDDDDDDDDDEDEEGGGDDDDADEEFSGDEEGGDEEDDDDDDPEANGDGGSDDDDDDDDEGGDDDDDDNDDDDEDDEEDDDDEDQPPSKKKK